MVVGTVPPNPTILAKNLETLSQISQLFTACGKELSDLVGCIDVNAVPTPIVIGPTDLEKVTDAWNKAGQELATAPGLIRAGTDPEPALVEVVNSLTTIRDTLRNQTLRIQAP